MDRTIPPGQSEKVEVGVTAGYGQRFTKVFPVETNDATQPNARLECIVDARVALELSQPNVHFGELKRDATEQTRMITLAKGDAGPIHPKIVSVSNPEQIKAEMREVAAGEKYELSVTLSPPWSSEWIRGSLVVDTGTAEAPQETIQVIAQVAKRLQASPRWFTIPVQYDQPLDLRAELVWSDNHPGKVIEATVTNRELRVDVQTDGEKQAVILHVPVEYQAGARDMVMVRTDDPEAPLLQLLVQRIKPPPPPTARPTVQ